MDQAMGAAEFGRLYDEHRATLVSIALGVTRDRQMAEDAVANAALRVWRRCQLQRPDSPVAYLVRAVQNESRDQLRRAKHADAMTRAWEPPVPPDPERAVDDRDVLDRLLRSLTDRQRLTLELRYLDGLADDDIARHLGVSAVTVRSNAHRALRRLRELAVGAPAPAVATAA